MTIQTYIDIEKLKHKISLLLESRGKQSNFEVSIDEKNGKFTLASSCAKLEVIVDEKWIGYDLEISESTFRKTIGWAVDTDNYPIQGKHAAFALEIFDEVYNCLEAALDDEIFIAGDGKRYRLAIPVNDKEFRLIECRNFFATSGKLVTRSTIEQDESMLKLFGGRQDIVRV